MISVLVASLFYLSTTALEVERHPPMDETDRRIFEAFLGHVDTSKAYCTPERLREFAVQPEDITWQASKYIHMPFVAYELTGETRYLDEFVRRMDALCALLSKGEDGFLGWYGLPYDLFRDPKAPETRVDVMLTEFVVSGLMAEFAVAVARNGLSEQYGEIARRWLDLAENHLVKKWDARGQFKDLGDGGAVYITNAALGPVKARLTQPHNKHAKILRALLALYDATGNDAYRTKAVKLGVRFKRCLTLEGDRYTWNYWDPAGEWDVHPDDPTKWKHWIGAEHRGGYFSLSLSQAVLLYERGLVFDATDMARFVKTQTEVCWNGDFENPKWARVDGQPMEQAYLCAELAPFEEQVYELTCGKRAQEARLERIEDVWHGGVIAGDWLEFKHCVYPKWKGGKPAEPIEGVTFGAFDVAAPGYRAPTRPPVDGR